MASPVAPADAAVGPQRGYCSTLCRARGVRCCTLLPAAGIRSRRKNENRDLMRIGTRSSSFSEDKYQMVQPLNQIPSSE